MAKRQFVVQFTVDSVKFGDALAELRLIGVQNLTFDLLGAHVTPEHFATPGAKPTRSAVVMQPRALPAPKKAKKVNADGTPRAKPGEGSKAQILKGGKNASQTVVDFLTERGPKGATGTEITAHLKEMGYKGSKGASTIAPALTYQGRATVDRSNPGVGHYFINPDWKPSPRGGKKPAHVRPDLYVNGAYQG